jgi:hypothetical protein
METLKPKMACDDVFETLKTISVNLDYFTQQSHPLKLKKKYKILS